MAACFTSSPASRQRAFTPGHQARYPASYAAPPAGEPGKTARGFLLPFGRRHSLLGHPVPPGDSAPLTIGLPHRQQAARTRAGFPCSARVRRGRGRAPSVPRGRRCLHGHVCIPYPPPAALQRLVPVTPVQQPVPGCSSHEASARVHWRSPLPAFPSPVTPGRIGGPLGFTPGFTPGWAGPSRACRGGDGPQALARGNVAAINSGLLPRRTHSLRATSRRNA